MSGWVIIWDKFYYWMLQLNYKYKAKAKYYGGG